LVDLDADVDGVDDFVAADLVDAEDVWVGDDDVFEGFVFANLEGQGLEDGHDAVGIFAGVDGDVEGTDCEVARKIGDGGDLGVGDDVDGAVAVAEASDAEAEVFDDASEAGDLDGVADGILVLNEDEDAGKHVFEDGLGSKADAEADDASGGDEGSEGDAKGGEDLGEDIEADDYVGGGAKDGCHGAELAGSLSVAYEAIGSLVEALDEEVDDGLEYEGEKEGEDDLRNAVLDEVGEVGLPPLLYVLQKVLVVGDVGGEMGVGSEKRHGVAVLRNWKLFYMKDNGALERWDDG